MASHFLLTFYDWLGNTSRQPNAAERVPNRRPQFPGLEWLEQEGAVTGQNGRERFVRIRPRSGEDYRNIPDDLNRCLLFAGVPSLGRNCAKVEDDHIGLMQLSQMERLKFIARFEKSEGWIVA
jgi:hypothetical protein